MAIFKRSGRGGQASVVSSLALACFAISLASACGKADGGPGDSEGGRGGDGNAHGGESTRGGETATGTGGDSASLGGGTARGGSTGAGGASPGGSDGGGTGGRTVIEPPHASKQVDLLFVVDNSISMADKQSILSDAVQTLTRGLLHPRCFDAAGKPNGQEADDAGNCKSGTPEFPAVTDLHVGVITTSLGSHGGGGACTGSEGNDRGQLLPKVRQQPDPNYPYTTWKNSGFVSWNKDPSLGISVEADLNTYVKNMILSAGQTGCGFEASLEAMYRFLIDPKPLGSIPVVTDGAGQITPVVPEDSVNPVLLQRKDFLRPDSTLAIVMLSDENDCSIRDFGQGWLVATSSLGGMSFRMPRATSQCEANPNDPCCVSCASSAAPVGCPALADDPQCAGLATWASVDDNLNLRCFDQKRRFGVDFLYPLSRYVDGLTKPTVVDASGQRVPNPLFPAGGRTPSMVFFTGILGVPWQDLAKDLTTPTLEYLTPAELVAEQRWPIVLGDPGSATEPPTPPIDKLMFETHEDRTTLFGNEAHPLVSGAALAPASSTGRPNPINGHESNIHDNSQLQYACILRLPQTRPSCAGPGCECMDNQGMANQYNHAVCEGTTQTHAKAHPSIRQLRVIREVASLTGNALPTSVCPKYLDGSRTDPGYGYSPSMNLLLRTMAPQLGRQ